MPNRTIKMLRTAMSVLLLTCTLVACGVETMGAAATGAVIKQKEIAQGQAQKEAVQQQLQQTLDQTGQRQKALEDATR